MGIDLNPAIKSVEGMAHGLIERLPYLVLGVIVFGIFFLIARITRRLIRRLTRQRGSHHGAARVLGRLAEAGLLICGAMVALVIALPSFEPGQLIQLLGISGVAFGFAFRDVLQNFLAGIIILITEPFRIGDQITVSGMAGTVENIETRATLLRTYDSRRIVIPNATLFTQSVVVDTAYPKRRLEHDIQLADVDDPHDLEKHMVSALKAVDGVQNEPPPEVYVLEVAPDTLTLRCRWWVTPTRGDDALRSQDQAMRAIRDCLAASARSEKQAAA